MKMISIAITLAGVALLARGLTIDLDRADSRLSDSTSNILVSNFTGAANEIDEAIRLWTWNSRYYSWRAYIKGHSLRPRCPRTSHNLRPISVEVDQQLRLESLADLQRSLTLNRLDGVTLHNKAWLEHLGGDDDNAARDWEQATVLDPVNPLLHLSYGLFLQERGLTETANQELVVAIELSPSLIESHFFEDYRKREPEPSDALIVKCIAELEAKRARYSTPILEAKLGKLYQYRAQSRLAQALLEDAVSQLPNLPLAWLSLGDVYASNGSIEKAIDCYRKSNVIDPSSAIPYLRMATLFVKAGKLKLASGFLDRALPLLENPVVFSSYNNRLYVGPQQRIDDVLPITLSSYASQCNLDSLASLESYLSPHARSTYELRSHTCHETHSPHAWP